MTSDKGKPLELAKTAISLLQALLPLVEKYLLPILPVNPVVRDQWMPASIAISAVVGIGSYWSTKKLTNGRKSLFIWGVGLCILVVALIIVLTHGLPLPPRSLQIGIRVLYVLFFATLGMAIGGALGMA